MTTAYALTVLFSQVTKTLQKASDSLERCPDPYGVIDDATYGKALRDAGIDDRMIYGMGDPVYMVTQIQWGRQEVTAYSLLIKEERGEHLTEEEQEEIDDLYLKFDTFRIFLLGIVKAAEIKTKEMGGNRWH